MQTKVLISVHNGATKVRFDYRTEQFNESEAKDFIYNTLNKIIENQNKLKSLGLKNNFFGLSTHRDNLIDISIIQGDDVKSYASGITFKFSQLSKVENKKEAFNLIFETQSFLSQNNIELID